MIEKRLARVAAPAVAHRRSLRACAAIGRAAPASAIDPEAIDGAMRAILRLGQEAAAELAAILDTPELQALDRAFEAADPSPHGNPPPPIARRMLRLIERYRRECGLDRLDRDALSAGIAARIAALTVQEAAGGRSRGAAT